MRADEAGAAGDEDRACSAGQRSPQASGRSTSVTVARCHARNHPGRRHRHAAAPDHPRREQAARAGLRQADDLLPAVDADAGRHPRRSWSSRRRTTPARSRACSATARGSASRSTTPCSRAPTAWRRRSSIGADFIGGEHGALVLGDNIFYGAGLRPPARAVRRRRRRRASSATGSPTRRRTASWSSTPTAGRSRSRRSRPSRSSNYAVPGLYFYDNDVVEIAREPQAVGARRARDHRRQPHLPRAGPAAASTVLERGTAWLDTGTFDSLHDAAELHPDRGGPAGPEDRLPRGGRLAAGLAHRRRAAPARGAAGEVRLRRVPAPPAGAEH